MPRVVLSGYILVPMSDLFAVQEALPRHIELTRQEAGCLVFQVTQDERDPTRFNVHEEFIDQQSFAAHQARVGSSSWGSAAANVIRHYQVTEVQ